MSAIPSQYITSVIGFDLKSGKFNEPASTLAQQIAIFGEPNVANEALIDETNPELILTRKQIGDLAGYGSLPYIMFDSLQYLKVPIRYYPQKYDTGSAPTETVHSLTITGDATDNTTHYVVINGKSYPFSVVIDDSEPELMQKILDTVNKVVASPVIATDTAPGVTFTTKWKGATSAGLKIRINVGKNTAGISYSFAVVAGTGTPTDITTSLERFGSLWNTIVINPYGEPAFAELEAFNGVPDVDVPIGRWDPLVGLPFHALFGSNLSDLTAIKAVADISARKGQVTNIACASPNSEWWPCEAAASVALEYGTIANNTPHLGMVNRSLSFSSAPIGGIGDMTKVEGREAIAQAGHSTSEYTNGKFVVKDFITTFHPDGEDSPKFREVRDITVDMNILYYIKAIIRTKIQGKITTKDVSVTNVAEMIDATQINAIMEEAIIELVKLGFIADADFSVASLVVSINPQYRANIAFDYLRTSELKQGGVEAKVGFFTVI